MAIGDRIAVASSTVDVAAAARLHRRGSTGHPLNAWWFRAGVDLDQVRSGRLDRVEDLVVAYCTTVFDAEAFLICATTDSVGQVLAPRT
jgi:hypothetical protein